MGTLLLLTSCVTCASSIMFSSLNGPPTSPHSSTGELRELQAQNQEQHVQDDMDVAKRDLTAALHDVRQQYENVAAKNLQECEEWYKSKNESYERQMREMEENFTLEAANYQDTINHLQDEIQNMKEEMAHHRRQSQERLNVNMALDIEIATYRKLLEGEESRISIPVHSFSNMSLRETNLDSHPVSESHSERTLLIKTVETTDDQVIDQSSKEQDDYQD